MYKCVQILSSVYIELQNFCLAGREFEHVRESMHSAISMNKTEVLDSALNDFSEVRFLALLSFYCLMLADRVRGRWLWNLMLLFI